MSHPLAIIGGMCNECPSPPELFASIDAAIDRGRWFLTGVGVGPPAQLKWLYTVGLAERFSHPELLVVGVCCAPCGGSILDAVAEEVAAGVRFEVPTMEPIELEGGLVHLRHVPPVCWESSWFAMWKAYYGTKPYSPPVADALQVVFMDKRGHFPWEPGCDPIVAALQQLPDDPPPPVRAVRRRRSRRHR